MADKAAPFAWRSRLTSALPVGGLGRSVSILAGGAALGQIIVVLSSVVINRLYSPTSFGQYGAATSLVAVLVTVTSLKYELAIPLPSEEERAANLLALSILVAVIFNAIFAVVLIVAGKPILRAFHADALLPYAWLLVLAQLGGGIYMAVLGFAIRHKQFPDHRPNARHPECRQRRNSDRRRPRVRFTRRSACGRGSRAHGRNRAPR